MVISSNKVACAEFTSEQKEEVRKRMQMLIDNKDAMWNCAKMYIDMSSTYKISHLLDEKENAKCDNETKAGYIHCMCRNVNI